MRARVPLSSLALRGQEDSILAQWSEQLSHSSLPLPFSSCKSSPAPQPNCYKFQMCALHLNLTHACSALALSNFSLLWLWAVAARAAARLGPTCLKALLLSCALHARSQARNCLCSVCLQSAQCLSYYFLYFIVQGFTRCRYRSLEIDRERISASESCCDTAEEVRPQDAASARTAQLSVTRCVQVMAVLRQVFGDIAAAAASVPASHPCKPCFWRENLTRVSCSYNEQRQLQDVKRMQRRSKAKLQKVHVRPSASTTRRRCPRCQSSRIPCNPLSQILDPGAAARGKIKKHLKQQVRAAAASADAVF